MECTRSSNDILQISWLCLSKIVSGLKKTEPILRSREEDLIGGSRDNDDTGNIGECEPSNVDDIKAWESANEHWVKQHIGKVRSKI